MINCLDYVKERKEILKSQISRFKNKPCLVVIQIGDDKASSVYVRNKKKVSEEIGIQFTHIKFTNDISEDELINEIKILNRDNRVHGIIVQLPIPEHINVEKITEAIAKEKDVDGFRHDSFFKPCTPKGIIDWLKYNKINLSGENVCVIGRSKIVGKPMVELLTEEDATVIWCNSKSRYLRKNILHSKIVISAIGKPNYFNPYYFSDDHIIIDVGINRDRDGKLCGDVSEDTAYYVEYKTPVPNGVGKLTVCRLMDNVVEAYLLNGGE